MIHCEIASHVVGMVSGYEPTNQCVSNVWSRICTIYIQPLFRQIISFCTAILHVKSHRYIIAVELLILGMNTVNWIGFYTRLQPAIVFFIPRMVLSLQNSSQWLVSLSFVTCRWYLWNRSKSFPNLKVNICRVHSNFEGGSYEKPGVPPCRSVGGGEWGYEFVTTCGALSLIITACKGCYIIMISPRCWIVF